jgi:hypothetical protein
VVKPANPATLAAIEAAKAGNATPLALGDLMPETDAQAAELLAAYDNGELKSVATPAELKRLQAAARATVRRQG